LNKKKTFQKKTLKKTTDSDEDDEVRKNNDSDDSDDETIVRHTEDVQTHDPKFLNSFTIWRVENQLSVEDELK